MSADKDRLSFHDDPQGLVTQRYSKDKSTLPVVEGLRFQRFSNLSAPVGLANRDDHLAGPLQHKLRALWLQL